MFTIPFNRDHILVSSISDASTLTTKKTVCSIAVVEVEVELCLCARIFWARSLLIEHIVLIIINIHIITILGLFPEETGFCGTSH